MTTATYWWGFEFGFCVGVGFVAAFLFADQWQRRRALNPPQRWRRRRCEIHDRPWPAKIAKLERETGVNPEAVANTGSLAADFANPDLIDCGHEWCRRRRRNEERIWQ